MTLAAPRLKFIIAGGVLALAFAYLLLTTLRSTTVYYLTVAELRGLGAQATSQPVRVAGAVAPGTVVRNNGGLELRFTMQDGSGTLPVVYHGPIVPDIFGEYVEVVVEGKLGSDGSFIASTLLAKCPSRFEAGSSA